MKMAIVMIIGNIFIISIVASTYITMDAINDIYTLTPMWIIIYVID